MQYFAITVFFYNPNIYPEEEFYKRLNEQERLIGEYNRADVLSYELNGKNITKTRCEEISLAVPPYEHDEFLSFVKGLEAEKEGGKRCEECFRLRLSRSYAYAKEHGFDYFGTTLSVSPHKNAVLLNEIGTSFLDPPAFLLSDFKKKEGYKTSILLSKKFDLYRQNYCGCEFSFHD